MWTVFFIFALLGVVVLLFYILIELNDFEKKLNQIAEDIKKHYEKS